MRESLGAVEDEVGCLPEAPQAPLVPSDSQHLPNTTFHQLDGPSIRCKLVPAWNLMKRMVSCVCVTLTAVPVCG